MSRKSQTNQVSEVISLQKDLNSLSTDTVEQVAPKAEDAPLEISVRDRAKFENCLYIEPKRTLKGCGVLPEKLKKEHVHAWEYVRGMFENFTVVGEHITFWLSLYPGDPDCMWEIPANTPVYVPRHVAKHLEEVMKYHKFDFIEKPKDKWRPGDAMESFTPVSTHYRGKFRAIGSFA